MCENRISPSALVPGDVIGSYGGKKIEICNTDAEGRLILSLIHICLPFSILVVTNFMKGVNRSLEEAALIDGATYFQIYKNVMLPMTVPAISTISIFNFLGAWNNILFPLLFINDKNLKPIALGLLNFNGERGSDYGPLMAAIVITVAVPLVIYLLFQEKVEGGLAAGAVKE